MTADALRRGESRLPQPIQAKKLHQLSYYDPTREYELMASAGLDFGAILASLTTAPADEFGWSRRAGHIAPGFDADVVVIDGDPTKNIRTLDRVWRTVGTNVA
jgi:imidazolonepropionase-like amidohydrolase